MRLGLAKSQEDLGSQILIHMNAERMWQIMMWAQPPKTPSLCEVLEYVARQRLTS